jgi:hypothetical protein
LGDPDLDKVQIEIVFRPIPQPAGMPGRHPQGEDRQAARPWRQGMAREPAVREAKSPSPTRPPVPSPGQAKPEIRPAGATPKVASAPATAPGQVANVAGPPAPAQPPLSPSQSTNRPAQNETANPPAISQAKPGGQNHT